MKILCEGIIFSGKTTLCKILEKELGITAHYEVSTPETTKMLEMFYTDQKRWAFALQIHFLCTRHKNEIDTNPCLMDRSLAGDRVFSTMLHSSGVLNDEEYRVYTSLHDDVLAKVSEPTLVLYLDCKPETAFSRIKKRGLDYESGISLDYIKRLNEEYLKWFASYKGNLFHIDTDSIDFNTDTERTLALVERIKATLENNTQR